MAIQQPAEDEIQREELPMVLRPKEQRNLDVFSPSDYIEVLKEKVPRPFIFGPVEFEDLEENEQPFPAAYWHESIISTLMRCPYVPADDILIHGFAVTVKGQTLKRASQVVKHSRFLKNLQVFPLGPQEDDSLASPNPNYEMDGMEGGNDYGDEEE